MLGFKNWLIIENIGSSVTDIFLERLVIEKAINDTFLLFEGGLQYSDEDDVPIRNRKLLNSILWMRWKAMLDRQNDIKKLKEIRDKHKKEHPKEAAEIERKISLGQSVTKQVSESSWRDFKASQAKKTFNLNEAKKLLQKLGYINLSRLRQKRISEEEKKYDILEALYRAAEESGNELPPDVQRLGVDKILRKAKVARTYFYDSLRNIFGKVYGSVAQKDSQREIKKGDKPRRLGYRNFGDATDVFATFAHKMEQLFTIRPTKNNPDKRSAVRRVKNWFSPKYYGREVGEDQQTPASQISKSGRWPNLGSGGYESEMGDRSDIAREFSKRIAGSLGMWLSKELDKKDRSRAQTTNLRRVKDTITNRARKKSIISKDLEYAQELKNKGQSTEPALKFYLDYLKLFYKDQEDSIKISSKYDTYRKEIMDDIVQLRHRYSDLYSIQTYNIETTLFNYLNNVLKVAKKKALYLGDIKSKKEDESDYFDPENNDKLLRGDAGVRSSEPQAIASNSENLSGILGILHDVMSQLAISNPRAAFAICVKWNLGCSPSLTSNALNPISHITIDSVRGFSDIAIALTKDGRVKGGQKLDCEKQLQAIGTMSVEEVCQRINQIAPGFDFIPTTIRTWITNGYRFICQEMKRRLETITQTIQTPEGEED